MPVIVAHGSSSAALFRDAADSPAEPFLIESVLTEIRNLLRRSRRLNDEAAAEAALRSTPAWHGIASEVAAVHERAASGLRAAARQDGVLLPTDHPLATAGALPRATEDALARCRRWARELEEHCAAAISQAAALGLENLTEALARWRRDLIGLERPLIDAQAQPPATSQSRRRTHPGRRYATLRRPAGPGPDTG